MGKLAVRFSRRRAARDLARLRSGELSELEANELNARNVPKSDYHTESRAMDLLLANMESVADHPDVRAWREDALANDERESQIRRWPRFAVAAGFLLTVAFSLQLYLTTRETSHPAIEDRIVRYTTEFGEQRSVTLADGTAITLNVGTQLLVDFSDTRRRVVLERGEAFFDVARDAYRPFSVDVGPRSVSALGTQFNILKLPDKFTLAVLEGVVSVHRSEERINPTATFILPSGETQVRLSLSGQYRVRKGWITEFDSASNQITAYETENIERLVEWRTGMIYIEGEELYKVVQELNRYSEKKILIEEPAAMTLKMYGVLHLIQVTTTLQSLEKTLPIKITHHHDRIVIAGLEK